MAPSIVKEMLMPRPVWVWFRVALVFLLVMVGGFVQSASAAIVLLDYAQVFTCGPAPIGPAPYASAAIDDGGRTGSVVLTLTVAGSVGAADVAQAYFNLNPAFTATHWIWHRHGRDHDWSVVHHADGRHRRSSRNVSVQMGTNAFKADGAGHTICCWTFRRLETTG